MRIFQGNIMFSIGEVKRLGIPEMKRTDEPSRVREEASFDLLRKAKREALLIDSQYFKGK